MRKLFILLTALLSLATAARAQTTQLNYSEHIAPILNAHCVRCHRPGEVAPFSLLTYADAAAKGSTIKRATASGYMPPWKPDPNYRHFLDENTLTTSEVAAIANWVDGGMPQGDPALAPPTPTFPSGSQLGTPDLVVPMAKKFDIPGNNKDLYRVFVLPVTLPANVDVAAVEFRAGNKQLAHHAIIGLDTTNQGQQHDDQDPGYGYTSFGGFGFSAVEENFAGWVPGVQVRPYPAGLGKKLYKKTRLLVQIHYGPTSTPQTDSSVVNVFFSRQPVTRYVQTVPALTPFYGLTNGPFVMPADQVKTFRVSVPVSHDVSVLSVLPHAHLLAKRWKAWAVKPNGDTINIVKIDAWNFRWQGNYRFPAMQRVPAGSRLECDVTYDNTAANPRNPNSPPQPVSWGENTSDEMLVGYFDLLPYQADDENMDVTGGVTTSQPLPVTLTSFTAQPQGRDALLRWATASELHSSYFAVESSVDGHTYQQLGQVTAAGSSAQLRSYQFTDANPDRYGAAQVYYRLRQVDLDGTATYSPVRLLRLAADNDLLVQAVPNPSPAASAVTLTIRTAQPGPATLLLTDVLGRTVARQQAELPAGNSTLPLATASPLAAGLYVLRVQQGSQQQSIKIVRQ